MVDARHVVLSGMPGAGKSTLAKALAAELERPWVDTDDLIAARAGKDTASVLREKGEPSFRALEAEVIREAVQRGEPHVIALGGGAVTTSALRHELLDCALVATLSAPLEVLVERTTKSPQVRPLLAGDAPAHLSRLAAARRAAYAECHVLIDTSEHDIRSACARVLEALQEDAMVMPLGERSYRVNMVHAAPLALGTALERTSPTAVVIVTDANVAAARAAWIEEALSNAPRAMRIALTPGESEKNLDAVRAIWDAALLHGVDRGSVIVAIGGGVVGDLAGFAASTLLRGVSVVQVPTSLLAMVDASVGGKTGFDHAVGKNLIGSFHQPAHVLCDVAHLDTLEPAHYVAGLAEIVKIGVVLDADLFDLMEASVARIRAKDPAILRTLIRRSIRSKIHVVRDDEHERGARALLNAGHTVGHAIETAGGYVTHLHGEAVALGLCAELDALVQLGYANAGTRDRLRTLLQALGLPTDWRAVSGDWRRHIGADKKRRGANVAFPVLRDLGSAHIEPLPLAALIGALQ